MPNLPGTYIDPNLELPALPNVVGERAVVPASWNDSANIMRQILDVLEREGQTAADELKNWLNAHRNK